jgi:hypothetical protein
MAVIGTLTTVRVATKGRGRRGRRVAAAVVIVLLCLIVVLSFAGVALAQDDRELNPPPPGSPEAPELDYEFSWWSAVLTFGLVIVFYIFMFAMSEKEFKGVILERFGPKR